MRIVLVGSRSFGAAVFDALRADGHDIPVVFSPAERPDGSGPDTLRQFAERTGASWSPDTYLRVDRLPGGTDLIVAAHSHAFVGRRTRLAARLGAIGYHPSLLPLHRGRDAVEWTIRFRDRVAGGSVYWLTDSVDAGDIAAQEHVFVRNDDDARSLWHRELMPLGLKLLRRVVDDLSKGVVVRAPQDHRLATWEPSIGRLPVFRPEIPLLPRYG